ncbi:hypothetical protein FO519_000495 [Halicephalobus sp. NKZ332]|nr:hypothetical protein FO519_000495 [Halicephalobus sp. NKZ332]
MSVSNSPPVTNDSPVVVVTGATSGIGKATAIFFANKGYQLSLSGRDEGAMAKTVRACIDAGLSQQAFPGVSYYCMSKAALDSFTKCLALELASFGVRVNAVNPGVIVTDVHKRSGMSDADYEQFLERGKTTHALGRVGLADEVAEAIYFLASPASSFTTGHLLSVDGGRGIMAPR